tara:strand:- start:10835 stop:11395 length:561 start_codon:yes stop_codon:yes gene_type:complete
MTTQKNKLNEGLNYGDLNDTIDPVFSIDRYRSKMGDDDNIVVVAFKTLHAEAAKDLVEFIESGYNWVLDANASPATDEKGKVTVFVEFERRTSLQRRIVELIEGITKLSNDTDWKFTYYKGEAPMPITSEGLDVVPQSPKAYRRKLMQEQELDAMMEASGLDPNARYKKSPEDRDMSFIQALAGVK